MAISVRERFGELGTLKAIGFSDRKILFFVLAESLLISLIGGLDRPRSRRGRDSGPCVERSTGFCPS